MADGRFDALMRSMSASQMRALAVDLEGPPGAGYDSGDADPEESKDTVENLPTPELSFRSGAWEMRESRNQAEAALGSDGMSLQAEVGTQDSRGTDGDAADALAGMTAEVDDDGTTTAPPQPNGGDQEVGDAPLGPMSQPNPKVVAGDAADGDDEEEGAIIKVLSYKLQNIQARAFTAINSEVVSMQKRLLQKHRVERAEMQGAHDDEVSRLQAEVDRLTEELAATTADRDELCMKHRLRSETLSRQSARIANVLRGNFSVQACFRRLQRNAVEAKYIHKMTRLSNRLLGGKRAAKAFARLRQHAQAEKLAKLEAGAKAQLEDVVRGIMARYEGELKALRGQLAEAKDEVHRGQQLRHELEERLRTTLMRGMSGMQLEALSLFRATAEAEREGRSRSSFSSASMPPFPAAAAAAGDAAAPPAAPEPALDPDELPSTAAVASSAEMDADLYLDSAAFVEGEGSGGAAPQLAAPPQAHPHRQQGLNPAAYYPENQNHPGTASHPNQMRGVARASPGKVTARGSIRRASAASRRASAASQQQQGRHHVEGPRKRVPKPTFR